MLSYKSAAELDKLTEHPSELVHVTIPTGRRVSRMPGVVIHRSARAEQTAHPARMPPRTRVEETILDLCGVAATLDEAVGWIASGLGHRLTTEAKLRAAMGQRTRMRWRRELSELLSEDLRGVLSVLEYRYVRGVERPHCLPRGKRQAQFNVNGRWQYRDVLYEAYCLGLEFDGRLAHPAESRWSDIHRDNAGAVAGITTLRFSWMDITGTPCQVAAQIAAVLSLRGYTRFRPCSAGCPVGLVGTARKGA
jgi:very-short-patch-repair endonuclease